MTEPDLPPSALRRRWGVLVGLAIGYVAVYLARKNLAVAIPLLQQTFGASKEQVGAIASAGTLAYALGKVLGGPVVDRIGGRAGFLGALAGVAAFSALTGAAPSLAWIGVAYAANRAFGAGAWGAMLSLVPSWFSGRRVAAAVAILSLSYVAGGAAATLFAREVMALGGGYRALFTAPAVAVAITALTLSRVIRRGPHADARSGSEEAAPAPPDVRAYGAMLRSRTLLLGCALSFLVTLLREAFNTWSVDFLAQAQGGAAALEVAAVQSIGFDLAGAVGIVAMGAGYSALGPRGGVRLVVASLVALAAAIALLPHVASRPLAAAALLAAIGFLVYGPFSLLGGLLSLDAGGARMAASAAGLIDGVGYVASALAGFALGRVLDEGGYTVGFTGLAALALASAALASRLRLRA